MGFLDLFVLAIGLAMDAFAVSVCKGLSLGKDKRKAYGHCRGVVWRISGAYAINRLFLGSFFADMITKVAHWIAFVLLAFIGGNMIKESFEEECLDSSMSVKTMLPLAIATSIDALAVGVTFAFLKVNIWEAISIIGVVTFLCSAAGVKIGSIFGAKYKSKAELAGGIILILIGIRVVLDGVGIL